LRSVSAVTVTYGDRFYLLKQVIDSALEEGVSQVIVVDNASSDESREKLREYERASGRISVVYIDENTGSAGGFKRGIERALEVGSEFIWLLDDDNVPLRGSLENLMRCWDEIEDPNKERTTAILSFRFRRYKEGVKLLTRKNSFTDFHILDIIYNIFSIGRFLRRITSGDDFKKLDNPEEVSIATYGGLFLHRDIIPIIGLPDERFFLYEDDNEYTFRITKKGGRIILCPSSKVDDVDLSWRVDEEPSFFHAILKSGGDFRNYYRFRNRVYFERKDLVTSRFMYRINRFFFLMILYIFSIFIKGDHSERIRIIRRAIRDGENGRLGKADFKLDP